MNWLLAVLVLALLGYILFRSIGPKPRKMKPGSEQQTPGIRNDQGSQDYVYQVGDEEHICMGCGRPGSSLCRGCASNWFR